MAKKDAVQEEKIISRLSQLQTAIDEMSACVFTMQKKILFCDSMLKKLAKNKPWLFKDGNITSSKIMEMDRIKYEESKIKDLDENTIDSNYNEDEVESDK